MHPSPCWYGLIQYASDAELTSRSITPLNAAFAQVMHIEVHENVETFRVWLDTNRVLLSLVGVVFDPY